MSDRRKWTVPPELAQYGTYTNHPGRAEELINSDATYRNNVIVAAMACEAAAQWNLLARLHKAGLLVDTNVTSKKVDCKKCGSDADDWCPDCGACEAGCYDGHTDNPCIHENAKWAK